MLKKNIIANFFGKLWPSLLGLFLVPVYLKYLGVEAYGLIGFFVSLQGLISFLDLGLSTTANREVAMGKRFIDRQEKTRNVIRTLEIIYGLVSVGIALGFFFASDWLAREWINTVELKSDVVRLSVIIFGITLALRWPVALYGGVLQGSEKQVLYNGLYVGIATLRSLGAALVVSFVSPTVTTYLLWQFFVAILELIIMFAAAWRIMRTASRHDPKVDFSVLGALWSFSVSVGINSLIAALIKQLDRVLISKLLTLPQLGYYTTAYAVYSALPLIASSFASAAFPRFAALISENNDLELANIYHKTTQFISFLISPISAILTFFSYDLLLIWTRSSDIARSTAPILSILAFAALFNSMMQIPFALQLAAGITWISLWNNVVNLAVLGPFMYFLIDRYEVAGAGITWGLFNLIYYLTVPQIMHRYILPGEKCRWYFQDTFFFVILGFLPFAIIYTVGYSSLWMLLFEILLGGAFYLLIIMFLYPSIRFSVFALLSKTSFAHLFQQKGSGS
ncbi:MAG TPA: oligosaccharide flippase family protein [Anaerolineales bacterium]|jgi:O-antigen/teichoic acid export membrane protein|nr:oligosaccharide flippase family protein [Anaerolineales bacterium]